MGKTRTVPEDKKKYECPVEGCDCGEGGKRKKCANPAALKNHVRFKHPEQFASLYPASEGEKDTSFRKTKGGSKGGSSGEEKGSDWGGWIPY